MIKVTCLCALCDKEISVEFDLSPTEEDKEGWFCEDCADHIESV